MSRRWAITAVIYMIVNAVLFGIGATAVLSIPALAAEASTLLWVVIAMSFLLALPIAYLLAPRLRARYQRIEEARRRARESDEMRVSPRTSHMPH
jgi:membrane protein implicated in regulation of membrane protease activity